MYLVRIAIFLLFDYSLGENNVKEGRIQLGFPGHGHDLGDDHDMNAYHHYRRQGSLSKHGGLDPNLLCVEPNNCRRSESQFSNIIDLMKLIQSIVYVHEEQKKASGGDSGAKTGGGAAGGKPSAPGGGGAKPSGGVAGGKPSAPGGGGAKPGGGAAGGKPSAPGGGGAKPGGGAAGGKPGAAGGKGSKGAKG